MLKPHSNARRISPMWRTLCAVILVSLLLCPVLAQGQPEGRGADLRTVSSLPSREKRWALIIGISAYEDSNITPLPGANNDAKTLRDALRDYAGFDEKNIILLTTDESKDRRPTKNNILRLLGNLSGAVPKDGLLLVAFSGHGIERQNRAFLLASDTPYNDNVRVLERTAINVQDDIKELIRDTGVRQVIILLDACRNDPTSGRSDSDNPLTPAFTNGFSFDLRNSEVEAFATLYATSVGARAYEYAREGKGYFTWAFVEGLKGGAADERGEVTLGGLVRYVERYVPQQVKIDLGGNKIQRPFSIIEGYKAEELVLGIAKKQRSGSGAELSLEPGTGERSYWLELEKRNTIAAYETYLSEYPNGEFVRVAKLRLVDLKWAKIKPLAERLMKYDQVGPSSEGLAIVTANGKYGFIDGTGREVIPPKYSNAAPFSEGLAWVASGGRGGYVDAGGKEVVPPTYTSDVRYDWLSFSEGLAVVQRGRKVGYIDKTGKEVIPPMYDQAKEFSEGLAVVMLNGKYGFINKAGKEVLPLRYDRADSFSDGLAVVEVNNKYGFVDSAGRESIPFRYDNAGSFSEGLAFVRLRGTYGFIDKTGREVISLKYDNDVTNVRAFSEGFALMGLNGRSVFIDKTGRELTSATYDWADQFREGLAQIFLGGKTWFIDRTGKEIIPPKYEGVWCHSFRKDGFIGVTLNGKKGFVDLYGNEYFDLHTAAGKIVTGGDPPKVADRSKEERPRLDTQAAARPARASVGAFAVELESCAREGGDVLCQFTVSNESSESKQFNLCHADYRAKRRGLDVTHAWDNLGNNYALAESSVGGKRWAQSSYNQAVLPPRVPAKLTLRFASVPAESKTLVLIKVAVAEQINMVKLAYADFKNVPITK